MYRYDEFDHRFVTERVAEFRDQVERRLTGALTPDLISCSALTSLIVATVIGKCTAKSPGPSDSEVLASHRHASDDTLKPPGSCIHDGMRESCRP